MNLSNKEVAEVIQHFIDGTDHKWEWDDFVSVQIDDPFLESIRKRCSEIEKEFPVPGKKGLVVNEEGIEVLKTIVKELREKK